MEADLSSVQSLFESVKTNIEGFTASLKGKNDKVADYKSKERKALYDSVMKLAWALEDPLAAVLTTTLQIHVPAAIVTASDLGLFRLIMDKGTASVGELAKDTGADRELLIRILRILVASGYFEEVGEYQYKITPRGAPYTQEAQSDYAGANLEDFSPTITTYPRYLKSIKYQKPSSDKSPFEFYHNKPGYHFFDYLNEFPDKQARFASAMRATMNSSAEDAEEVRYPYENELIQTEEGEVAVVDVGGGRGHYLQAVANRNPAVKGRFVNQDLKACLDTVTWPTPRMELMAHDFFQPQPLKGARFYQLRRVCHDWPDDKALEILKTTAAAMDPQRSRLQLVERIIPSMGASLNDAVSDMTMLLASGMERTQAQWQALISQAGLEIESIHRSSAVESLIQCKKVA